MTNITSTSNSKIVFAKKLLDKKYRDKTNLFVVETEKVIEEAIKNDLNCKEIYVLENKNFDIIKKYQKLFDKLPIYCVKHKVFAEISRTVSPDGIVGIFEKKESKKEYLGGNFLVLDCLQNPDNMGAILRTAAACNFTQIFVINCADEYNPKTLRSAMGNQFKLKIEHINYEDMPVLFKDAKLYIMDMKGDNIFNVNSFEKNVGFVVGNEGNGVSTAVKSMVDMCLSIPMANNVESLNASVSASVVMYHIYSKEIKKQ